MSSRQSSFPSRKNNAMLMNSNSATSSTAEEYPSTVLSQPYPMANSGSGDPTQKRAPTSSSLHRSNGSAGSGRTGTSSHRSASNRSLETSTDEKDTVMIEEKRRRPHGDGYTIHQYLRGRLLGKGGFAKVYHCTAMDSGKHYAVKVVAKANLVKARARQKVRMTCRRKSNSPALQLQAEIKIHRTLKHKNVCQYKHYFEDRQNCYILLELCHNQSLNEMIKRRKRLTEPEAAYFLSELLQAVRYMHDSSVIHRDLKLGNLFLDRDIHVKVGDLGLATRVEDRDEKRKTICGTPNYIAPEIIQGDKSKRGHSFEVDIWSMGVILYTVLVGKPPYEAKDVKATYQRILANEYCFPSHTELSHNVKDLIVCMLQSDPRERPSLDYIESHPFLADQHVTESLPQFVLHRAPTWEVDEFGVLQCVDDSKSSNKPMIPRSSRQPFASRNPNMPKKAASKKPSSGIDNIDYTAVVRNTLARSSGQRTSAASASAGFEIYDESKPVQKTSSKISMTPKLSEETIVTRTKALTIATDSPTAIPPPTPEEALTATTPTAGTDADLLNKIVDQLDEVMNVAMERKGSYRQNSPRIASSSGPEIWVTRYVDYTSKYGLGFLLNDGGSGVYFNDSTKTALQPYGETFQYVERKRDERGVLLEPIVETYSLSAYPDSLKKKVTLLTHFRNYLMDQQRKAIEAGDDPIAPWKGSAGTQATDLVYIKKWIQTKHAILFRLSNSTIQVVFYDQTEVLLTPDTRFVTYVDKNRVRATYHLSDELVGTSNELEKRLKYTKEIVIQLLTQRRT